MSNMRKILALIVCCLSVYAAEAQTQRGDTAMVRQAREVVKSEDYAKALDMFLAADKTFVPDTTDYYGNLQHNIGYCYYMLGDKRNTAVYWEKTLAVFPQFSDKHGQMLEFLASIYDDLGDQTNLMRILELTEAHNQHELTKPMESVKDYLDRAQYYAATGDNAQAKSLFLQVLEKAKTEATPAEREDIYSAYAKYLGDTGDRQGAAENYVMAARAREATDKGKDRQWAMKMYLAGLNLQLDRQWQSAYNAYTEAEPVFAAADDEKYVRNCQSNMGTCMYFQQNYEEAKTLYQKVRQSLEADKETADYAKALRNVAKADVKLQLFEEAIEYLQQAADIYEKQGDNTGLQSALSELNIAKMKAGQDADESIDRRVEAMTHAQSQKILDEERKNQPLYKLQFGEDGLQYVSSLGMVAELTYELEDKAEGVKLYEEYLDKYRTALRRAFVLRNEQERQRTWQEEQMTLDSLVAHTYGYDSTTVALAPSLNAMAYDVQLLSKGVLLNSSIEFGRLIEESGDVAAASDYAKAKELEKRIQSLQADNATGENTAEITRLKEESDRLMLSLMQRCKELGDYTKYMDYTWQDVREALGNGDVAIEFAEVKNGVPYTQNIIVALVNAKALPAPLCLPICPRMIAAMMVNDTLRYETADYGTLVWGYLWPLIDGCKRLYFSPTAEFASLGIEYLQYQGKPIIDRCEVYRLSSTKELCRECSTQSLSHAALFGGIDYGASGEGCRIRWRHTDERSGQVSEEQSGILNFAPLAGTEREVKQIQKLLEATRGHEANVLTGAAASEQTLRGLSGDKQLDVLHIATHGAFTGNKKTTEAEAMQCSMLAFSGVNDPTEDSDNDGTVTAQDIAEMNLRHCGMAVLSACETGLGKLGGDGVFGLQRGFKNAGVHTLLMSLNKVDDAATTELMTQFYKALLATPSLSPNAALRQAQQYLRNNGYASPKYWASFIILDGQ